MLGQKLTSVFTCPTTLTCALLLTIVNDIRQKSIPFLFDKKVLYTYSYEKYRLKELVADKTTV